jgi:undecaprenyl-diphosphatase
MLEFLDSLDKSIFLFLNNLGGSLTDPVMKFFSYKLVWIPMYLTIALFIFIRAKRADGKIKIEKRRVLPAILFLTAIFLTFAATETIANTIKDLAQRPRPSHNIIFAGNIRMLEGAGGLYGFVSNHAANAFGLAIFTSLLFSDRRYSIFIFSWAALVAISRIFVGKHYPGDILGGAIVGLITGYLMFRLASYIKNRFIKRENVLHNR